MSRTKHILFLLTIVLLTFSGLKQCHADSIEKQLQSRIPKIIDYLNERNLKTVGVLKFRVKKPGQKTSDGVGSINSLLADRLEVGMILQNPFEDSKKLNIIKGANLQVAKIEGANHLTEEGRAVCFNSQYEIAWGDSQMKPDAFITGVIQVHKDNQQVTVGILCFNKSGGPLEAACEPFQADLNAITLSELGDSFTMRGGYDSRVINGLAKTLIDANKIKKPEQLTQQQVREIKHQVAVKAAANVKAQTVQVFLQARLFKIFTHDL